MDEPKLIDDLRVWNAASERKQEKAALEVESLFDRDFQFLGLKTYAGSTWRIATFLYKRLKIELVLLPGGEFTAGLTNVNREALHTIDSNVWLPETVLPSAHIVTVKPFLIARLPIDEKAVDDWPIIGDIRNDRLSRANLPKARGPHHAALLTKSEAATISIPHSLDAPTEHQWEYAYRGGSTALFPWGDSLPVDRTAWGRILLGDFSDRDAVEAASNAFGLAGMQWGELCSDPFEAAYEHIPDLELERRVDQVPAMRGGAALFEPWNDLTWTQCISGARWDTGDYAPDRYAVRLVRNIPKPKKPRKAKR